MQKPQGPNVSQFELDDFLPYQLAVLASRVSKSFAAIYEERFGLSVPQWRVLAQLGRADGPLSVRDLARLTELEKSKISRAVAKLEARGLVAKAQSNRDKRLLSLEITPQGMDMITSLAPQAAKFEHELMASLGSDAPAFRAALAHLLDRTR